MPALSAIMLAFLFGFAACFALLGAPFFVLLLRIVRIRLCLLQSNALRVDTSYTKEEPHSRHSSPETCRWLASVLQALLRHFVECRLERCIADVNAFLVERCRPSCPSWYRTCARLDYIHVSYDAAPQLLIESVLVTKSADASLRVTADIACSNAPRLCASAFLGLGIDFVPIALALPVRLELQVEHVFCRLSLCFDANFDSIQISCTEVPSMLYRVDVFFGEEMQARKIPHLKQLTDDLLQCFYQERLLAGIVLGFSGPTNKGEQECA